MVDFAFQVSNWFINARRRKIPSLRERYGLPPLEGNKGKRTKLRKKRPQIAKSFPVNQEMDMESESIEINSNFSGFENSSNDCASNPTPSRVREHNYESRSPGDDASDRGNFQQQQTMEITENYQVYSNSTPYPDNVNIIAVSDVNYHRFDSGIRGYQSTPAQTYPNVSPRQSTSVYGGSSISAQNVNFVHANSTNTVTPPPTPPNNFSQKSQPHLYADYQFPMDTEYEIVRSNTAGAVGSVFQEDPNQIDDQLSGAGSSSTESEDNFRGLNILVNTALGNSLDISQSDYQSLPIAEQDMEDTPKVLLSL